MPRKNRGNRRPRNKPCKAPKKVNKKEQIYKRVTALLEIYYKWTKQDERKNIYSLICDYYKSANISSFFDDYDYVANNIDVHQQYLNINYGKECNAKHCLHFKRNYRNTNELSTNNTKRITLYYGINDERQISVIQYFDILHNILFHLIHLGLRYCNKNCKGTSKTSKIIASTIFNHKNRFVTYFNDNNESKENDEKECKYIKYSRGIRFFYHNRYKNVCKEMEQIPGSNVAEPGNNGFIISDWYVAPKYCDLKEEILTNKFFTFSIEQWNNTNIKGINKWNRYKNKINTAYCLWHTLYGYNDSTIIRLDNILCLLLYTNYDFLATKLTETYRWKNELETNESLKQRHSHFVYLGKGLKETIEVFGATLTKSKHKEFYHGINMKMLFSGLKAEFCSPTSTTLFKNVAINFAQEGFVLTINNSKQGINYFNCISFSDFPAESEMLFIAGLQALDIIGLTD
eukprot:91880_1